MLALNDKPGDKLSGKIDPTRIAAAGHSAGGITTVGLFSGSRDDRLVAGIVLSGRLGLPVPFYGKPAPMLFVHGKLDKTVPFAEGLAAFNAVPWPKAMMSVTKGGHVAITKDFAPVLEHDHGLPALRALRRRRRQGAAQGRRDQGRPGHPRRRALVQVVDGHLAEDLARVEPGEGVGHRGEAVGRVDHRPDVLGHQEVEQRGQLRRACPWSRRGSPAACANTRRRSTVA